ncbi:site-specific integrase [Flaviaesturariibacter aridisoli]|uniref:Site-specific integrase n=1 Tax=Flaviaesturariibacter aridisoli TaxID=2545761 RepID=A0A4R4DW78_9BACT|nr:site-specific integrase [Flaviaesturariibacter aridisoli]TCZ68340.1 site-specific integrase [Flaviaesturariibacter aridisoli]
MNIIKRPNATGDKITFYYDFGRGKGQRPSTGIWIYASPKDQIQKNHNKEALALLEVKRSQLVIESQSIGSAFIPSHKFKQNFIEYFQEYVDQNKRKANRHLGNSFKQFKEFVGRDFISPMDITENFCKRFRQYLLDKYTGETPSGYYTRFKWVVRAATSDGYFQKNPTEMVSAKTNPSKRMKENLESEEYLALINTPCTNEDVKSAFLFSCYTGLRWVDVKALKWDDIKDGILTTRIIQAKTGRPVTLTLHPIAASILQNQKAKMQLGDKVFRLPTADGANKVLEGWVKNAKIEKHITWSCARLSFSILLQDQNIDDATVAYLMGHTSTDQVRKTYKRHRPKNQMETIKRLPAPDKMPFFLALT